MTSALDVNIEDLGHEEALKFVKRFKVLLEINNSINSTMDLEVLLRTIIDVAALVMNAEASSLALFDVNTEELVFHLAGGVAGETIEHLRLPKGKGIAGWVQENGEPVIVPDVSKDERFYKGVDEKSEFQTRSIICVPMNRTDKTIGVLQVLNKKEGTFDTDDLLLFMSLANIAAIAVENSQLYQILQQTLEKVKQDNLHLNNVLAQLERSENEMRQMKNQMQSQGGDFTGSLSTFVPANVLQMLGNDMKTGKVVMKASPWEGHIYFEGGQVYHAELQSYPPFLSGETAIYEMLDWNDGTFSFTEGEKTADRTVQMGACMPLIIEGLRRSDEAKVLLDNYPSSCKVRKTGQTPPTDLTAAQQDIYNMSDGHKTLQVIWQAGSWDKHTFYQAIDKLLEARALELEAGVS